MSEIPKAKKKNPKKMVVGEENREKGELQGSNQEHKWMEGCVDA